MTKQQIQQRMHEIEAQAKALDDEIEQATDDRKFEIGFDVDALRAEYQSLKLQLDTPDDDDDGGLTNP